MYNVLRDEGTYKIYEQWRNEQQFLPLNYQPKYIEGEPEEQYTVR